jgi:hypothetical protein
VCTYDDEAQWLEPARAETDEASSARCLHNRRAATENSDTGVLNRKQKAQIENMNGKT